MLLLSMLLIVNHLSFPATPKIALLNRSVCNLFNVLQKIITTENKSCITELHVSRSYCELKGPIIAVLYHEGNKQRHKIYIGFTIVIIHCRIFEVLH